MEQVAFWALAVLAIVSGLAVITQRKPVVSALALTFNLVTIAGLYMLLNAQFMAFLQVIVYAGAIMVLIVFVVMLLNLSDESDDAPRGILQRPLGLLLALAFVTIVALAVRGTALDSFGPAADDFGTAGYVGRELFTRYFYPFEAISLLLLVAMIGAVMLAKRRL